MQSINNLRFRETRVTRNKGTWIFAGCYYCKDLKRICNTLQDSPVWQVFFLPVCLCITAILSTEGISPVHHRPMPLTNWQCKLGHKPLGIDMLQVILYCQIAQKIWQPAHSMIRHINQGEKHNKLMQNTWSFCPRKFLKSPHFRSALTFSSMIYM